MDVFSSLQGSKHNNVVNMLGILRIEFMELLYSSFGVLFHAFTLVMLQRELSPEQTVFSAVNI